MKKVGGLTTVRGRMTAQVNGHRVQLWDGKFTTGFKVVDFRVAPPNPTSDNEIAAKIFTTPTSRSVSSWFFNDSQEMAWCTWGAPTTGRSEIQTFVDPDNMFIEDIYMSNYTNGEGTKINYFITIQKYEFSEWMGALQMIRNLGQGGPDND